MQASSCSTTGGEVTTDLGLDQHTSLRLCSSCEEEIPANRLKAIPTASKCVRCVEASGDVPRLKRFDETQGEEVVSTYYKHPSAYLSSVLNRDHSGLFKTPAYEDEKDAVAIIAVAYEVADPVEDIVKVIDAGKVVDTLKKAA